MIYEFKTRIRYSEVDSEGFLDFPGLLGLFQDTSVFHGEDNNATINEMDRMNITWVLAAWQVRLYGTVGLGEFVTSQTWAYRFRKCVGYRNFRLLSDDGRTIAESAGQYALIDTKTMQTVPVSEEFAGRYTVEPDHEIKNIGIDRKIPPLKEGVSYDPVRVTENMIDTNKHVNNLQFVRIAGSFLTQYEDFRFNAFRAEYKKQAFLGDVFYPTVSKTEKGHQVSLKDADGGVYFNGEWFLKED